MKLMQHYNRIISAKVLIEIFRNPTSADNWKAIQKIKDINKRVWWDLNPRID